MSEPTPPPRPRRRRLRRIAWISLLVLVVLPVLIVLGIWGALRASGVRRPSSGGFRLSPRRTGWSSGRRISRRSGGAAASSCATSASARRGPRRSPPPGGCGWRSISASCGSGRWWCGLSKPKACGSTSATLPEDTGISCAGWRRAAGGDPADCSAQRRGQGRRPGELVADRVRQPQRAGHRRAKRLGRLAGWTWTSNAGWPRWTGPASASKELRRWAGRSATRRRSRSGIDGLRVTGDGLRLAASGTVGLEAGAPTAARFHLDAETRALAAGLAPRPSPRQRQRGPAAERG